MIINSEHRKVNFKHILPRHNINILQDAKFVIVKPLNFLECFSVLTSDAKVTVTLGDMRIKISNNGTTQSL